MRNWFPGSRRAAVPRSAAVLAILAAMIAGTAPSASAAIPDPDPSQNPCISGSTFSLTASRSSVVWGQSVVLNVSVNAAHGCSFTAANMFFHFIDKQSGKSYDEPFGYTQNLIPPATGHYDLLVINSAQVYHVASASVNVTFPVVDTHRF